ncbi:MAG: hypothetical protein IJU40_08945, partial [Desulfovibrionaceae bacterium]|nr:hypothetical protein [Desulfovibrionaceae bacterium]
MNNYLVRSLGILWLVVLSWMLGLTLAYGAPTAKRVLVLPFQAVAGPEMPNAAHAIPEQIIQALNSQEFETIPLTQATQILRSSGSNSIDLAKARAMGAKAGADLVIYGNFNQLGSGFSMETRLVPVAEGQAVPLGFEKNSLLGLSECTQSIASRASQVV